MDRVGSFANELSKRTTLGCELCDCSAVVDPKGSCNSDRDTEHVNTDSGVTGSGWAVNCDEFWCW